MNLKKVEYPTALSNNVDRYNDNIDVFVETTDGTRYTLTVCTPQFYYSYMDKEGLNYVPSSPPDVIVKELTDEYINQALMSFCRNDGYLMKAYFFMGRNCCMHKENEMDRLWGMNNNIEKVQYQTALNEADMYDDKIDILVEAEDGYEYKLTVCTPQFYYSYMDKEGLNYVPASPPDVIVKELTDEYIMQALQSFCENEGYWMKAYCLLGRCTAHTADEMDRILEYL